MTAVYININGSVSQVEDGVNFYNSLNSPSNAGSVLNARDATDTFNTGWNIDVTANFNDETSTGATYSGPEFAQGPMSTMARLRTIEVNTAQITISGLNNSNTYDLTFGANAGIVFNPTHIVIGSQSVDIVGFGSDETKVGTISGVSPVGGSIVIDFSIGAGEWEYAGLSAMRIVENIGTDVTGDMAATEAGADAADISGDVVVAGDLAATEVGSDVFEATAPVPNYGLRLQLRDTDTGELIANEAGLIWSVRETARGAELVGGDAGTTDADGWFEVDDDAVGTTLGLLRRLTIERSDGSRIATFYATVKNLNL